MGGNPHSDFTTHSAPCQPSATCQFSPQTAPLSGSDVLSRALPWTTGWKDFKSTSGVAPLQDFLAGWPWHCCLAMCGVATNDCKGTAAEATHLPGIQALVVWDLGAYLLFGVHTH